MFEKSLSNVFPLAVGIEWVYSATLDYSYHGTTVNWNGKITETIVEQKELDDHSYFQMDHHGHHLGRPVRPVPYFYIINNNYLYQLVQIGQLKDIIEGTHYGYAALLAWPLTEGQIWGDASQLTKMGGQNVWNVLGIEDISTPAGSHTGCYQVGFSNDEQRILRWFYPGVGFVRYEYHSQSPSHHEIWELETYKSAY